MNKKKMYRQFLARAVMVFTVCLLIFGGTAYHIIRIAEQKEKDRAEYNAKAATRRVEAQLKKYLVVSEVLKNLVNKGYEISDEDFGIMSELMMDKEGVIEAIEYARNGVITEVYPMEGNEDAIGLNLLENPAREKEATLAMTSGQFTIAGPFELAQGGMGALLLDPIYTADKSGAEHFWGFSVLVLDWDAFLDEVQLEKMERLGYHYQLWHTSPSTGEKVIIAQCEKMDMKQALQVVCDVPNDTWYFEIMPDVGWVTSGHITANALVAVIVSLLISFLYWQYAVRRYQEKAYKKKLEKAADEAKSANEAKTRFLFNMSHDIRTPMNAILGFANIAEENISEQKKVQDSLAKIKLAGKELLSLINEVLNISRIESGNMKPVMESADLYNLSQSMKFLFEQSMTEKEIHFEIVTEIEESHVICDIQHMRGICVNLLSNAQKFTPKGGNITFAIRQKEAVTQDVSEYEILISDTGIGMSEEFQEVQFELFEREESKYVSKTEGTGLGLSIVKRLVDMLSGKISCISEKGKGTTYTLTFQLEKDRQETSLEQKNTVNLEMCAELFEGKHVLLVEDNELNREIAVSILVNLRFRVDTAEDGVQAVEKVKTSVEDPYDLIVMDVQMPNMNGYEATKAIRNLNNRTLAKTPIVAMTANAFEEDKKNAMKAGMNDHIAKPVELPKMVETLARVFQEAAHLSE